MKPFFLIGILLINICISSFASSDEQSLHNSSNVTASHAVQEDLGTVQPIGSGTPQPLERSICVMFNPNADHEKMNNILQLWFGSNNLYSDLSALCNQFFDVFFNDKIPAIVIYYDPLLSRLNIMCVYLSLDASQQLSVLMKPSISLQFDSARFGLIGVHSEVVFQGHSLNKIDGERLHPDDPSIIFSAEDDGSTQSHLNIKLVLERLRETLLPRKENYENFDGYCFVLYYDDSHETMADIHVLKIRIFPSADGKINFVLARQPVYRMQIEKTDILSLIINQINSLLPISSVINMFLHLIPK